MAALFLTEEEITMLTGWRRKAQQIKQLRQMGIAFWINACGQPIVCRAVIEGKAPQKQKASLWEPEWAEFRR